MHLVFIKMMRKYVNFFVITFTVIGLRECSMKENNLPQMYKMQNYKKCQQSKGTFCLFDFKITPYPSNAKLRKVIEASQKDQLKLDRSVLSRMICVPSSVPPETYGVQTAKEELMSINVTIGLLNIDCEKQTHFSYFNTIFWIPLAIYVAVLIQSTRRHYLRLKNSHLPESKHETIFSMIANAQKLWKNNENPDFQRLKSIQGIRVFNLAIVVFYHTVMSLFQIYVEDIDELEKNYESSMFLYAIFLGAFSVQIFFLISAFLLTNQIYDLRYKHGDFTLEHCWILMLNRFFRFLPTLLISVAAPLSGIFDNSPHTIKTRNMVIPSCQCNWWLTLLQMNYLLSFHEMCTPGLWYLSVDTIYYIVTLGILYLVLKHCWNLWKVTGIAMIAALVCFSSHIYVNNYEYFYQPYPKPAKIIDISETMNTVYVPPLASWPSSLIGVALGYVYYHNKHKQDLVISKKFTAIWWLTFSCMPLLILHLSTYSYTGLFGAIAGSLARPLFVGPLGLGILGMSFGLGGVVKTFLGSKVMVVLANVTYCAYVSHFYHVYAKGLFLTELLPYKANHIVFWIIFDTVLAFIAGAIFTILIEYPGVALQKLYVPQIRKTQNKSE